MTPLLAVVLFASPNPCHHPSRAKVGACAVAAEIRRESPRDATYTYLAYVEELDGQAARVYENRGELPGAGSLLDVPVPQDRASAAVMGVGILVVAGIAAGVAIRDHHVLHGIPGREAVARQALASVYARAGDAYAERMMDLLKSPRPTDPVWREELRARSANCEPLVGAPPGTALDRDDAPPPDDGRIWVRTQQNGLQDVEVGLQVAVAVVDGPRFVGTITAASPDEVVLDGDHHIAVADIAYVLWSP